MRKRIALKLMLPLIIIFVLTLMVNLTTTQSMQGVRDELATMVGATADAATAMVLNGTVEEISATLSTNGIFSSM